MLRAGASLPVRLLRDAAPKRHVPLATITASNVCRRTFSTSESHELKYMRGALIHPKPRLRKKKRYSDPQQKRISEARKRKNEIRQAELKEERARAMGDPIRGKAARTPFVESFKKAMKLEDEAAIISSGGEPREVDSDPRTVAAETPDMPPSSHSAKSTPAPELMNSFVTPEALEAALHKSRELLAHRQVEREGARDLTKEEQIAEVQATEHENAREAMNRILAVSGANSKQRKHINIQRCIAEFGRHKTDLELNRPVAEDELTLAIQSGAEIGQLPPNTRAAIKSRERIGPDTGSSEVQIAILTEKINRLADILQTEGKQDKNNKHSLALLVHRRQKLLQYFEKKSRGGPAWQHLIKKLGLTPATWKGEISLA